MNPLALRTLLACLLGLTAFLVGSHPAGAAKPRPQPALGINLAGSADWNTELPFVDVLRFSRAWISQENCAGWGHGPKLTLDPNGWVQRLEPDCFTETPPCTVEGGHYSSGVWAVLWDGDRVANSQFSLLP